jgi:hypothetical protein
MNEIEKQAAFYRGYLPHDRSLVPLTIILATSVTLWLMVYVADAVGGVPRNEGAAVGGSACLVRDPRAANSLTRALLFPLCRQKAENRGCVMPRLDLNAANGRQHG